MADLMTTDDGAALESPIRPPAVFGAAENSQDLMSCDLVQQHFTAALQDMPVPVSQPPGDAKAETPEEALALWREVKRREREEGYR